MKILIVLTMFPAAFAQTDWPRYGHDPGGMQYSPLKQIDTSNVSKLQVAWTYDTRPPAVPASDGVEAKPAPRNRPSQATPLAVGGVLYLSTAYGRVVALDPESGKRSGSTNRSSSHPAEGSRTGPAMRRCPPRSLWRR